LPIRVVLWDGTRFDLGAAPFHRADAAPSPLVLNAGRISRTANCSPRSGARAPGSELQKLRVLVGQLRRKLEPDPAEPRYVIAEPGIGYRMEATGE
jgi:DNA-binding response OmpR family regulator